MAHYPNPLLEQLFVTPESGFGALADAASGGALRHTRASFTLTQERAPREDRHGSRGLRERVSRRRRLAYEIESYVCPSGISGAPPDVSSLLEAHGLVARTTGSSSVLASPAPTSTSCTLAGSAAFDSGDAVGFLIGGDFHVRHIETSAGGAITWATPLPQAPAAGATAYSTVGYRPDANPSRSVSVWRFLDGTAFAYPGCVGESWELSLSGGAEARFRFSGKGRDEILGGSDRLRSPVDASATNFPVGDADRFGAGMVLGAGSETVKVVSTDTTADTITVQRGYGGSTPASHAADSEIAPSMPAVVTRGSPAAGVSGRIHLKGGTFHITEATLTFKDGLRMREPFGEETAAGFAYPENRRVRLTMKGFLTDETVASYGEMKRFSPSRVEMQIGNGPGRCLAVHIPRFEADVPEVSAEPGQEIPLAISGACLETSGDDELFVAFA